MGLVRQFLGHVLPGVMRPLRILWNQMIGFVFVVFAVAATPSIVRSIQALDTPQGSLLRVLLVVAFAGLMAYFGISSFLKARKISRS